MKNNLSISEEAEKGANPDAEPQAPAAAFQDLELRAISLYGDLTEEKASELVYGLLFLKDSTRLVQKEEELFEVVDPINFYISTYGGSAAEMFSLYDMMRFTKKDCDIYTIGLGKVFSAGTLLLAAGTKGQRRIGANCRVMLHDVVSGHHGSLHNLENEVRETRWTQKTYIKLMAAETEMTERQVKSYINRKTNVYLTAEEAVELGIADEII